MLRVLQSLPPVIWAALVMGQCQHPNQIRFINEHDGKRKPLKQTATSLARVSSKSSRVPLDVSKRGPNLQLELAAQSRQLVVVVLQLCPDFGLGCRMNAERFHG